MLTVATSTLIEHWNAPLLSCFYNYPHILSPVEQLVLVLLYLQSNQCSLCSWTCLPPHSCLTNTAPNRGLTLWIQQFCAMFLKRLYNSLRFYGALISQLLLPMLFVLFALILVITFPNPNQNDPRRALRLNNSGLSNNVTLFYAQFGNEASLALNFSVRLYYWLATKFVDRAAAVFNINLGRAWASLTLVSWTAEFLYICIIRRTSCARVRAPGTNTMRVI